jgi:hypothetical protein
MPEQAQGAPSAAPTLVFTRCVFFQHHDASILEAQVNWFLTHASLAALHRCETTSRNEEILITLWFEPMPNASNIGSVYEAALRKGMPQGADPEDFIEE